MNEPLFLGHYLGVLLPLSFGSTPQEVMGIAAPEGVSFLGLLVRSLGEVRVGSVLGR
jgi:hypothetical protein